MENKFITTGYTFKGYDIEEYLGMVSGVFIRTKNISGMLESTFRKVIGGEIVNYNKASIFARQQAFDLMLANALELGANGVIGVKFDSSDVAQGITEIFCYGTAVKIKASKNN